MTNRNKPTATSRLKQDYMRLKRDPVPYISAEPLPHNILEWHYVVKGPEESPYYGGYYHGTLLFHKDFPFKPPSIYMFTPNGRFKVNTRLCLSISDFHPDTWNPAWSVATILTGLLSFMVTFFFKKIKKLFFLIFFFIYFLSLKQHQLLDQLRVQFMRKNYALENLLHSI